MSFVKIGNNFFEQSTLLLRPKVNFVSSSLGITGSEKIVSNFSKCIKQIVDPSKQGFNQVSDRTYDEMDFQVLTYIDDAANRVRQGLSTNIQSYLSNYLNSVGDAVNDNRFNKLINVFRFDVPVSYNQNFNIKNNLRKNLIPFHQHRYSDAGFHYTNYNTLNFFTGSGSPHDACLIYPNLNDVYTPSKSFSLNFWINPRYSQDNKNLSYNAGTIFHMSSSICVSLISGSSTDKNNLTSDFKIMLQLSHSADTRPDRVNFSSLTYPNDLIFTSSNALKKNNWHNVTVRWGSSEYDNYDGAIIIDDKMTEFNVPSSSLYQSNEIITIGNYLNTEKVNASKFFNNTVDTVHGLTVLNESTSDEPTSQSLILKNGLNAEIHDIKLFNKYLNDTEVFYIKNFGIKKEKLAGSDSANIYSNLLFYVPVFFYPITKAREVMVTPFQTITEATTNDPFNVQFSFGVGGKHLNLENFTREFIQGEFPRLQSLTGSVLTGTIQNITADQYIYHTASLVRRNNFVLPNDNGLFQPDYYAIQSSPASSSNSYKKTGNFVDYSKISLENLIPTSSLFPGLVFQAGSIFDDIVGSSPENPGVAPGSVLSIAQRTRDVSSNEITVFDISNLFYGNRINPGTFEIIDNDLTGSNKKIKIQLKDNKKGSLYRSDALTKHAEWNNVGDILYDEGMVIVKSPHLFYYCKDSIDMTFKGEQNIHTLILNVPVEKQLFNSSSNFTFKSLPPSNNVNDADLESFYVTAVNIHDDNFNIIMKAHFAQPILKTEDDEFVIRLKQDF
jgi:hypothetical protein